MLIAAPAAVAEAAAPAAVAAGALAPAGMSVYFLFSFLILVNCREYIIDVFQPCNGVL